MIPYNASMTTGVLIPRIVPSSILKVEVDPLAVETGYFQIHDAFAAPATGAVPKKVWPLGQSQYKEFSAGELSLAKGCVVVQSSTELTYTAVDGGDIVVQIEFAEPKYPDDLSTSSAAAGQGVAVWTNGQAPKRLYQVRLVRIDTNNPAAYLQWYAVNGGTSVLIGATNVSDMVANEQRVLSFGENGLGFNSLSGSTSCKGCTVLITTTATGSTPVTDTFDTYADFKFGTQ